MCIDTSVYTLTPELQVPSLSTFSEHVKGNTWKQQQRKNQSENFFRFKALYKDKCLHIILILIRVTGSLKETMS